VGGSLSHLLNVRKFSIMRNGLWGTSNQYGSPRLGE